jgi:hypothetical protein
MIRTSDDAPRVYLPPQFADDDQPDGAAHSQQLRLLEVTILKNFALPEGHFDMLV